MKPLALVLILAAFAGIGAYKVFTDLHTNSISDTATLVQSRHTEEFRGFKDGAF
jgi:hypothetical protein